MAFSWDRTPMTDKVTWSFLSWVEQSVLLIYCFTEEISSHIRNLLVLKIGISSTRMRNSATFTRSAELHSWKTEFLTLVEKILHLHKYSCENLLDFSILLLNSVNQFSPAICYCVNRRKWDFTMRLQSISSRAKKKIKFDETFFNRSKWKKKTTTHESYFITFYQYLFSTKPHFNIIINRGSKEPESLTWVPKHKSMTHTHCLEKKIATWKENQCKK